MYRRCGDVKVRTGCFDGDNGIDSDVITEGEGKNAMLTAGKLVRHVISDDGV